MPLKEKRGSVSEDLFSGPWGRIAYDHQSTQTIRFQKTDKCNPITYSYPYRSLSRWEYHKASSGDEIIIQAVTDTVTISGDNLETLVEALDEGRLHLVREMGDEFVVSASPIRVKSIVVRGPA